MIKRLPILFTILGFSHIMAQSITPLDLESSGLEGVIYGETLWLDTTNNDTYELLITGASDNYSNYTVIGTYNNNTFEVDTDNTLLGFSLASADKADFNNDGFMDFIITGNDGDTAKTALFLNNGSGQFSLESTNIVGATNGKIRAIDFNKDLRPDVLITGVMGATYGAKLYYQNASGGFEEAAISLMANYFGDITAIDINNDTYLDLVLTGFDTNYAPNTQIYLNINGVLSVNPSQTIDAYYFTGTGVLDADNDGDKDIIISGSNGSFVGETSLYLNDGSGNFSKDPASATMFEQVFFGDLDIVDFNNDGYDDIFSTGQKSDGSYDSKLYINNTDGTFSIHTEVSNAVMGVSISSCDWADFDNDGDQDLLITGFNNSSARKIAVYRNETLTLSTPNLREMSLKIHPNPARDWVSIESPQPISSIAIYNSLGQAIANFKEQDKFNVSSFQSGVYLVVIKDSFGNSKKVKLLKQ